MTHITNMAKTNAAGFGVPCKAFESWIAVFEKANIDADAFFESVGLDTSYVLDFDNEIPWAKWVECVDELERRLGGRGSFEEHFRLGDILPEIDSMRVLTKFAGLFASPSFLYRVLWRWFGPSMFPGVEATLQKKERNVLVGTIEIPEGWADSPAFFRLNRAVMMEAPMLVGRGPARIELDISRRRGTYGIYLPPSGSLFDRVRRAFRSAFTGDDLLREMETQNRQLVSSYRKLERANARLQEQQRELEQNARNFRTLIERSTESIAVLADGEIIYVNEAMVGFLEYANEAELLGRPIGDILVEPDIVDLPTDSVATDNPFDPRRDIAFVNSDGDVVKGDVNKLEMEFEGRPSVVLISRDVTKRREMAARMMQMDRMIAVGTLAAGVAHEINNPLTYVVSNTDFSLKLLGDVQARLDDVGDVDESVSESLSDVHDKLNLIEESLEDSMHGGKRVKTIVRDLQTFSREEDERAPEAVNVNEVISNAVKMGWHEIRHRAELVQSLEAAEPVHVDSSRLGQVVLNLLVNAAQAIRGADASDNTIWLSSYEQDDSVVIEVEDTGKGISDEDMDQIFDPFFTTKPVGEGDGAGPVYLQESHRADEWGDGNRERGRRGDHGHTEDSDLLHRAGWSRRFGSRRQRRFRKACGSEYPRRG